MNLLMNLLEVITTPGLAEIKTVTGNLEQAGYEIT